MGAPAGGAAAPPAMAWAGICWSVAVLLLVEARSGGAPACRGCAAAVDGGRVELRRQAGASGGRGRRLTAGGQGHSWFPLSFLFVACSPSPGGEGYIVALHNAGGGHRSGRRRPLRRLTSRARRLVAQVAASAARSQPAESSEGAVGTAQNQHTSTSPRRPQGQPAGRLAPRACAMWRTHSRGTPYVLYQLVDGQVDFHQRLHVVGLVDGALQRGSGARAAPMLQEPASNKAGQASTVPQPRTLRGMPTFAASFSRRCSSVCCQSMRLHSR